MYAMVGGIIGCDHNLSGKQVLDSQIPLENLGIAGDSRVQVTAVVETPVCQLSVRSSLRRRQPRGERIFERRILGDKVIFREIERRSLRERRSCVLKVRSHIHAIEDSNPTT